MGRAECQCMMVVVMVMMVEGSGDEYSDGGDNG